MVSLFKAASRKNRQSHNMLIEHLEDRVLMAGDLQSPVAPGLIEKIDNVPALVQSAESMMVAPTATQKAATAAAPTAVLYQYLVTRYFGGTWCDAEKRPGDDGVGERTRKAGCDDDMLCWAAAASNVLKWTGWGNVAGMNNSDAILRYFATHWTDQGGFSESAWKWWFSGSNPTQYVNGVSHVDVAGGGFFRNTSINRYFGANTNPSQAMGALYGYFRAGCGTTTWISGPMEHMITCWGFTYDSAGNYRGVYVTDSDDAKGMASPPDQLKYYNVKYSGGRWYLQNYYGYNNAYIRSVYALQSRYVASYGAGMASTGSASYLAATGAAESVESADPRSASLPVEQDVAEKLADANPAKPKAAVVANDAAIVALCETSQDFQRKPMSARPEKQASNLWNAKLIDAALSDRGLLAVSA